MKKLFKALGVVLGLVVLLAVVAAIALPLLLDADDVKARLAQIVEAETGRALRIPGDVSLSVFPWLGAEIGTVELGNAAGFDAPVFARAEKVDVRVKLAPLLERRVEMGTVTLHGLILNLERKADGSANWEILGASGEGETAGTAAPEASSDSSTPAIAGLAIGGLDVQDAALNLSDASTKTALALQGLSLKTGPLLPGQPVKVTLAFDLSSVEPPIAGRVNAQASVGLQPAIRTAKVDGLELTADLKGAALPGEAALVKIAANALYDGTAGTLTVTDLNASAFELKASGNLKATGLETAPEVTGTLNLAQFNPRNLLKALGADPIETADGGVLKSARVEAVLAANADSVTLKPLSVTVDDSRLEGMASVGNFARPAVRFDLKLDQIDLDRYLPPGADPAAATPGAASGKAATLPSETLRALDAAGTIAAGKLKVANLRVSDLSAKLSAKDGVIRVSPIAAKLYDGSYAGNVSLDARGDTPRLGLDEQLTGVQLGPLLTDLQGDDPVAGTATVSMKLSAAGTEPERIKRTLDGDIAFTIRDGALKGVNIGKLIRDARAKLKGESSPADDAPNRTDFAEITGTARVRDGVVRNEDLAAKSPLLRLTGAGEASLPAETVDYRATATVVATSKGQGGKDLTDLAGIPIPVRITGTFSKPEYGLDVEALAKAFAESKAKELVDAQKEKVKEKVEAKVKEKVGDAIGEKAGKLLGDDKGGGLLKGLLGN